MVKRGMTTCRIVSFVRTTNNTTSTFYSYYCSSTFVLRFSLDHWTTNILRCSTDFPADVPSICRDRD